MSTKEIISVLEEIIKEKTNEADNLKTPPSTAVVLEREIHALSEAVSILKKGDM